MHEAAAWLVKLQEETLTEEEQKHFDIWQDSSDSNRYAWQRAQDFLEQVDSLPKGIASAVLNRPIDEAKRLNISRLALILASGPLLWGSYKVIDAQQWNADYRTAKGEKKAVTLPDGTRVTLNTATAFDVSFNHDERSLFLREGEIEVNILTADPLTSPPFTLKTQEASLSSVDANVIVRQYKGLTRVGVVQGAVEVTPELAKNTNKFHLKSGLQADLSSHDILSKSPLSISTTSWLDNMLAVHNMPLKAFIQEVSRYHSGLLRVSPEIQEVEISGAFPIKDINVIFKMLSNTYPIAINQHLSHYWVTLEAA